MSLLQENISLTKDVQDLKISLENIEYTKHQLQTALNDANRRLEEEDRVRAGTCGGGLSDDQMTSGTGEIDRDWRKRIGEIKQSASIS